MFAIVARDLRATYSSPFGYGLTAGFLGLAGVLLVLALRGNEARLDGWFAPLFLLSGVLAALLTMRALAEEERSGALELLLTAPVRVWQVVVAKWLAVAATFALVIAGTVACPLLVSRMGDPDPGPIVTGYVGFVLVGLGFSAVGLAASAATASQLVASATTVGLLLALWFGTGADTSLRGRPRVALDYLSPSNHVTGFLRGTLALSDVVYYLSVVAIGLAAAAAIARRRR